MQFLLIIDLFFSPLKNTACHAQYINTSLGAAGMHPTTCSGNLGYIFLFVALHSWEFIFHLHTAAFIRISSGIMCLSRQTPLHWKRRRVKRVRGIRGGIAKPFSSPYILSVSFRTHCWGPRCWQRSWCLMRCKVQALTLHTWNRPPDIYTHTFWQRNDPGVLARVQYDNYISVHVSSPCSFYY